MGVDLTEQMKIGAREVIRATEPDDFFRGLLRLTVAKVLELLMEEDGTDG